MARKCSCTFMDDQPSPYGGGRGRGAGPGASEDALTSSRECHGGGWHARLDLHEPPRLCPRASGRHGAPARQEGHPVDDWWSAAGDVLRTLALVVAAVYLLLVGRRS